MDNSDDRPQVDVINPATEESVATISLGSEADVNAAVAARGRAFPMYSGLFSQAKVDLLESLIDIYKLRSEELAWAISTEMGSPN